MLFVTIEFLIFFAFVYTIFWALPPRRRMVFLAAASLFFYASWSPVFAIHFILIALLNWLVMEFWRSHPRKWIFIILQVLNVLNIAFFKYFYLLADVVGFLLEIPWLREEPLREEHRLLNMTVTLPLAISFYTFQIMSYGFDLYRGKYTRRHNFLEFFLYISFFPQLIAGPIMRASELLGQIGDYASGTRTLPNPVRMKKGLWLILIGIIKKVFIAEALLRFAEPLTLTTQPGEFAPLYTWLWVVAGVAMLYADFSAYSDFARGFGYMFGLDIPINFRAPFLMHSFTDLWRRWHLTFVSWLRDYIYIPLGGNRVSEGRQYANLIFTFTLGGLWHGATYSFLIWGFIMGVFLCVEAFLRKRDIPDLPKRFFPRSLRVGGVWILYLSTGVFFFVPSPEKAMTMFLHLFNFREFLPFASRVLPGLDILILSLGAIMIFQWFEAAPRTFVRLRRWENLLLPVFYLLIILALIQAPRHTRDFFYFQF